MPQQLAPDFDVEEVLGKLDISAKIKLLSGQGFWHTASIPGSGIPSMRFSDGKWAYNLLLLPSSPYVVQDLTVFEAPDVRH